MSQNLGKIFFTDFKIFKGAWGGSSQQILNFFFVNLFEICIEEKSRSYGVIPFVLIGLREKIFFGGLNLSPPLTPGW